LNKSLVRSLKESSTNEVINSPLLRVLLSSYHFRKTGKRLDIFCPICVYDVLKEFKKEEKPEKYIFMKKQSFKLKGNRRFLWRGEWISNENFSDKIAVDWLNYRFANSSNLVFSETSANYLLKRGFPEKDISDWAKASGENWGPEKTTPPPPETSSPAPKERENKRWEKAKEKKKK
jgi:hypothetical protein